MRVEHKTMPLSRINAGETFMYEGILYLRTNGEFSYSLLDGTGYSLEDDTLVQRIDAKVVVE